MIKLVSALALLLTFALPTLAIDSTTQLSGAAQKMRSRQANEQGTSTESTNQTKTESTNQTDNESITQTTIQTTSAPAPVKQAESTGKPSEVTRDTSESRQSEQAVPTQEGTSTPRKLKVALALGGGGTRGYAHIGALRVLKREGIPIDIIAGTSMGAIVGGMYCAGLNPDEIEKKMMKKAFARSYYTVPIPVRVAAIPIFIVPHLFGYHPYDGLYVGNRFAKYMNDSLPATRRDIEELKIPFCAVAANLLDGKAYALKNGNLGRAIQASSAVPELRRPVPIDDKLFVDGGIAANLPVTQAKAMGADLVIAVDVDGKFDAKRHDFRKILSVGHQVINMILSKIDEDQAKAADILIEPDVNGIHLLSSKPADGLRAIAAGEAATLAALPEIRSRIQAATLAEK